MAITMIVGFLHFAAGGFFGLDLFGIYHILD